MTNISPLERPSKPADRQERLHLMRESAWRVAELCDAHLHLLIGSLEVADDVGAAHHAKHAVEHMRAVAKLMNQLAEERAK